MFTLEYEGSGIWLLFERLSGDGLDLTLSEMEQIRDLITAALQDNDLQTKGETQ